jgi:hypothetical protein
MSGDGYSPFEGRRREPAMPVLVERLWRLRSPSGRVLSCALYLHPHGIESRCGYRDEADLLMSVVEKTPDAAKAIAEEWKQSAIEKGFLAVEEKSQ